ncbi:DUF397 domain-containing protein [Allokutzneria albata]|uniref:DUF397 domain-containing protein n=1 Tax=Allokutzneria albata TaxID=211114 RepID=A0A1G9R2X5_ALLAB|nr:DUF397 domain-containing protein [Allokutzneria albata]SDM17598.1 protein of unknown function [Allokutzneria albata]
MTPTRTWRKSSYTGNDNNCVELSLTEFETAIRDSKQPNGPVLTFTPLAFTRFIRFLRTMR